MTQYQSLIEQISQVPLTHGRRIIAIAGAPASGKSTLAENLHPLIPRSCVLPMDGFHRGNDDLERHGLLPRKGAPNTFDVAGFKTIVEALRQQGRVDYPTFDRSTDSVVPNSGTVTADTQTVLVEGNYLLLDVEPWNALIPLWDFTILLDVPMEELERRLIRRWLDHGHDADSARQRAEKNDLPNARYMVQNSVTPDLTLR